MNTISRFGVFLILAGFASAAAAQTVSPTVETDPVPSSGDAADDPAIWVHPSDRSQSVVIGTDKQEGIGVYDMSGNEIQFLDDGDLNNVDIRYGFPLGGELVDLVTTGNRSNDSIAAYIVNPNTRMLEDVAAGDLDVDLTMYGSCMYHSQETGEYYAIVNSKSGDVEQYRLFDNGSGEVDVSLVRDFDVGGQVEGCVADDELGFLYIGEETEGVWKYGAEPDDGTSGSLMDTTDSGGNLEEEVEGITIYYTTDGEGYVLVSSQGTDEYMIYERTGDNDFIGTFEIVSGNGIDGTSDTDGIDVSSANLGPNFPQGVFIAQDGSNSGDNQNYKLVPWEDIADEFDLRIDNTWDPRSSDPQPPPVVPEPPTNLIVE